MIFTGDKALLSYNNMWKTLIFCICFQTCLCQIRKYDEEKNSSFNIVGIFEEGDELHRNAFDDCMSNADYNNKKLMPVLSVHEMDDSFSVWMQLCKDLSAKTVAVLGPRNQISNKAIFNHCSKYHIPYLQAAWQSYDLDSEEEEEKKEENNVEDGNQDQDEGEDDEEDEGRDVDEKEICGRKPNEPATFKSIIINFYPDPDEIAIAYAQMLKFYKWERFIVLYEDDYGLLRVQKIMSNHSTEFLVIYRKLDPDTYNYEIFKELSGMQESRIILDCHVDNIKKYLEVAAQLNMVNSYQHYILTSMDTSKAAEHLSTLSSNFTWLSITEHEALKSKRVRTWTPGHSQSVVNFPTDALIMDDVAQHVLKAVQKSGISEDDQGFLCNGKRWRYGAKLQEAILNENTSGISGKISFDCNGRRKDYTLYFNEFHQRHLQTIATWKSDQQEFIFDETASKIRSNQTTRHNFVIMSRPAEPYIVIKKCYVNGKPTEACDEDDDGLEYEGFSVDLVKSIFEVIKTFPQEEEPHDYTFEFQYDGNISYGQFDNVQKKWNGLIGKLLDKKIDLVVCDLTMTEARKKLVDFSVPIMTLGISILFTKDNKVSPDILAFLKPYSVEMWIYTGTAYCIVSVVLYVCSRISPADWENPQPCDKEPEELENIWNFKNSTWLTMGSIMTQGCDILPKAFGSRWVCTMWWFFAMIVCQTYIAQLAASMTTAMENAPIESIEDLAKQTKVLYGAFEGGSTFDFFKYSKDKTYRKIYENMMATPGVLVSSNEVGEKRVTASKNKYAYFMESATLEYKLKRNCGLRKVGGELDSKDYGIAMPANSPYRSTINRAILKLKENNKLNEIKEKWWNTKFGARPCPDTKDENDVEGDLEIENLLGAFLVLIGGLFICLFITAAEFMNEVRNIVVREQVTHKEVLVKELKASLNFFQLQKPVIRNPSRAPSPSSSQKSLKSNRSKIQAQFVNNFLEFEKGKQ